MSTLTDNDFHHRIDLFEPGDTTALVCVDVPEVQRLIVENLTELGCKIHTGPGVKGSAGSSSRAARSS